MSAVWWLQASPQLGLQASTFEDPIRMYTPAEDLDIDRESARQKE